VCEREADKDGGMKETCPVLEENIVMKIHLPRWSIHIRGTKGIFAIIETHQSSTASLGSSRIILILSKDMPRDE
jgi:hypothetical protein